MYDYGDYAGAHYHDLSGDKTAAIVIGRRKSLRAVDIRRLKQMNESQLGGRLRIVTYDALLDKLKSLTQRGVEALEEVHLELTKYRTVRDWGAADYI